MSNHKWEALISIGNGWNWSEEQIIFAKSKKELILDIENRRRLEAPCKLSILKIKKKY